jgi:UDP:flavonoid glycosyltransferase YjiC (YdhE family)
MPFPLLHGEHIHFIESETEIKGAVEKIINDQSYRHKLENGARAYFDKYLAPEVVVKKLIDSLN